MAYTFLIIIALHYGEKYSVLSTNAEELVQTLSHFGNRRTRTYIWNVEDLEKPNNTAIFYSTETAVDHNMVSSETFTLYLCKILLV